MSIIRTLAILLCTCFVACVLAGVAFANGWYPDYCGPDCGCGFGCTDCYKDNCDCTHKYECPYCF